MGNAVLFILMFRLLLYSSGSGVKRVKVVWHSGFSARLVVSQKLYVGMVVCILIVLVLVCVDVMVMLSA